MIQPTYELASAGGISGPDQDNSVIFRQLLERIYQAGGGRLLLGPGLWRTGPIELYSNTELYLDEAAILSFIPDPALYLPVPTRWEGVECFGMQPCIYSKGQEHIRIAGKGIIDGSGEVWWSLLRSKRAAGQREPLLPIEKQLAGLNPGYRDQPGGGGGREMQFLRPPLIQFYNCRSITLEGVTVRNSPFWTIHPVFCEHVHIRTVQVYNPPDAPNTDGIDIDSCRQVEILDCVVDVGDDGIALKSGSGPDGIRAARPTSQVVVRSCQVGNGHGGIVIGSETAGGVFDVLVEDCLFRSTDRGIRIKTRRGRGGAIHQLRFRNLVMENNLCPLAINMYYRCGADPADQNLFGTDRQSLTAMTPRIYDIHISGLRASDCRAAAAFLVGLPEAPLRGLELADCAFSLDPQATVSPDQAEMFAGLPSLAGRGLRLLHVEQPSFQRLRVEGADEPFVNG